MKIFDTKLHAQGFLTSLISAKLVNTAKRLAITPATILTLNLNEDSQTDLKQLHRQAKLTDLYFENLKASRIPTQEGVDSLIANLTIVQNFELPHLLISAYNALNPTGVFIFATLSHKQRALLKKYPNPYQYKMLDEQESLKILKKWPDLDFLKFKEHLIDTIHCYIFIVSKQEVNALKFVIQPGEAILPDEEPPTVDEGEEEITATSEASLPEEQEMPEEFETLENKEKEKEVELESTALIEKELEIQAPTEIEAENSVEEGEAIKEENSETPIEEPEEHPESEETEEEEEPEEAQENTQEDEPQEEEVEEEEEDQESDSESDTEAESEGDPEQEEEDEEEEDHEETPTPTPKPD